jgi:GTP-binding protein
VERTRLLVHLIDITQADPLAAYHTIQEELAAYGHGLADKPQILALNKIDAMLPEDVEAIAAQFEEPPLAISAASKKGLDKLLQTVWKKLDE